MAVKRDIGEKKKPKKTIIKVVKRGSRWPITPKERKYNPLFKHMRPEDSPPLPSRAKQRKMKK